MPLPTTTSAIAWDQFLAGYPNAHILQTSAWGELKSAFGWKPRRVIAGDSGAQILFRRLPLGFSLGYIPKGPLGPNWDALCPAVDAICRQERAWFLKVEPDAWDSESDSLASHFSQHGFIPSPRTIQPRRTIVVDLTGTEADILARMKQKTRYNIRLAEKKDVTVRTSNDVECFYRLMLTTGARDEFGVHSLEYYRSAYDLFHPHGEAEIFLAEYSGEPLAALMVFVHGTRAWYFYGASSDKERNRMPAYLLQWEAMRWARSRGCTEYDLWGVPDASEDQLEAQFETRSDGLWGVYRFKRGFGGALLRSAPAYDRVYFPLGYRLYTWRTGKDEG